MIEAIEINQFQGHEYTFLELDPGVNVIKGQSHKGKSSIIRAIRWNILNKPRGEGFRSNFARPSDVVEVGLQFSDGFVVRSKGKKNQYEIEGDSLSAVKTDVPEEIQAVLQMDELNISSQFDQPYLLMDSPGDVARNFQDCVGLNIINQLLKKIKSMQREFRSSLKHLTEDQEEQTKTIRNLRWIDPAGKEIESLKTTRTDLLEKNQRNQDLCNMASDITETNDHLNEINEWLKIEPSVNLLLGIQKSIEEKKTKSKTVRTIVADCVFTQGQLKDIDHILTAEQRVVELSEIDDKTTRRAFQRRKLVDLCVGIGKVTKSLENSSTLAETAQKRFDSSMKELGYCPLCEQKYVRRVKIR